MTKLQRLKLIGPIVFISVLFDQASKYFALIYLDGKGVISLFGDCLRFVFAENRGGFLSLGAAMPDQVRQLIFVFATSLFLLLFFTYILFELRQNTESIVASSLIIGGGIGNLIDRVFRDGAVVDFANVGIGSLRTGIFNIADMFVLFGCVFILFSLIKGENEHKPTTVETA